MAFDTSGCACARACVCTCGRQLTYVRAPAGHTFLLGPTGSTRMKLEITDKVEKDVRQKKGLDREEGKTFVKKSQKSCEQNTEESPFRRNWRSEENKVVKEKKKLLKVAVKIGVKMKERSHCGGGEEDDMRGALNLTAAPSSDFESCLFVWSDQCVIVCPLFLLQPVTAEAVGFLSVVGVFIAALALVFLFINKMLCFSKVGRTPCMEQEQRRRSGSQRPGLVKSWSVDGSQSSSDSDNQVMKQFEISVSRAHSLRSERQPPRAARCRDNLAGSSERRNANSRPSDCEDDFPPAVTEATAQRNLQEVAPDGTRSPPQHSESPTACEPLMSEDVQVGHRDTANGSTPWTPQVLSRSTRKEEPGAGPGVSCAPFVLPAQDEDTAPPPPTWPSPPRRVSKCCDLLVSLEYRAASEKLLVTVVSARDLPDRRRSGTDNWQVHVVLMPAKKQRHKTSLSRVGSDFGLDFGQTFALTRVETSRLAASALRFRMYALEGRILRRRMMGEKLLPLAGLDQTAGSVDVQLVLVPRGNMESVDSELSLAGDGAWSSHECAELLMGLSYSAATGRMSVEIIKGSRLGSMAAGRPPDTFARLTLLNSVGREISRCKTSVRRAQPNPVFKETFVFQVALFQLSDVTLMTSVYGRRSLKRKEMIGWAALGQNSSGEEERLHWRDMKEAHGTQVCRWHVLLDA
ncbi:synaptotagmin-14 isoform X3 [Syngnathus scovelli]|uniref:synaptotagmin-14 isoform X3 n=1 Tax=Syngnathus scovelli TaxID=161590 RepID=UPI00210FB1CF|nr:synaptotagmin-14 isoform X3 [Syngnathus scovelli]